MPERFSQIKEGYERSRTVREFGERYFSEIFYDFKFRLEKLSEVYTSKSKTDYHVHKDDLVNYFKKLSQNSIDGPKRERLWTEDALKRDYYGIDSDVKHFKIQDKYYTPQYIERKNLKNDVISRIQMWDLPASKLKLVEHVNSVTHANTNRPWRLNSSLLIVDPDRQDPLSLNDLLPSASWNMLPSALEEKRNVWNEEESKVIEIESYKPLKEYSGAGEDGAKDFKMTHPSLNRDLELNEWVDVKVAYGDLLKTGGLLALLHEISHAWQAEVQQKREKRKNFETAKKEVESALIRWLNLDDYIESYKSETGQVVPDEVKEKGRNQAATVLADLGVDNIEIIYENIDSISTDQHNYIILPIYLMKTNTVVHVSIKCPELIRKLDSYINEEREAWAHAIKILRYLREKGWDLEPNIKNLKDLEEVVHDSLSTYDIHLTQFESISTLQNFTRKR